MFDIIHRLPFRSNSTKRYPTPTDLPEINQIYAPPPLPSKRKRTLTLPLPSSGSKSSSQRRQWTSAQDHSGFFAILPYDVRRIIYELILAGHRFHIIRLRKRLRHVTCSAHNQKEASRTCWGVATVDGNLIKELEKNPFGQGLLDVLQTCRQAYTEAINVLYSSNVYDINGPETMISFSKTILSHRLNAIRSLQLTWAFFYPGNIYSEYDKILLDGDEALWTVCWAVIRGMNGLSDLLVWLSMSPAIEAAQRRESDLFQPLIDLRPKRRFEVRVSWAPPKSEGQAKEEYPFKLIRLQDEDWGPAYLRALN